MHTIMTKTQVQSIKNLKVEESKAQDLDTSTFQYFNNSKYSGRAWKEKKKISIIGIKTNYNKALLQSLKLI